MKALFIHRRIWSIYPVQSKFMGKNRILAVASFVLLISASCVKKELTANFEDQSKQTILDYCKADTNFSSFVKILQVAKLDGTMSAYNPNAPGYTMFLPTNQAVADFFINNNQFSSLEAMLADTLYVKKLARFHVINAVIETNNFPFGAIPDYTLSGDQLTVGFVVEPDTSYYKINNLAPIVLPNVELSNGYVHVISKMLQPITRSTYEWISGQSEYSIFLNAINATGLQDLLNLKPAEESYGAGQFTLLLEPDSVFNKRHIFSLEDLANYISPGNTDYTSTTNPLNSFIRYHVLTGVYFLDDFVNKAPNYNTYSEVPLNINGYGLDIAINKGKQNFDTLVNGADTTIIDFVGFYYDESNIITQSGAIHFINQILELKKPTIANQTFEFWDEPFFNTFRQTIGAYQILDSTVLTRVKYSGSDLFFVENGPTYTFAWNGDYLFIQGDFMISYTVQKIVQGKYTLFIRADASSADNALVEVAVDGKKIGGIYNLTSGGSQNSPFIEIEIGTVEFFRYMEHTITITSRIPGKFSWDYVRFEPKSK